MAFKAGNMNGEQRRKAQSRILKGKVKGKVHCRTGHEGPKRDQRYSPSLSVTLALDEGGWSAPRPGSFTPVKDPVHIV